MKISFLKNFHHFHLRPHLIVVATVEVIHRHELITVANTMLQPESSVSAA